MNVDVGILIALVGCFVGLAGWLSTRDKRTNKDAEWRGNVSGKLDGIQTSVTGINQIVGKLDDKVENISNRLARVEESTKSAHHRIDTITKGDSK